MEVTKTLRPGQPGTHWLMREHGEQLVTVRYRRDTAARKQFITAEIIVAETEYIAAEKVVGH